MKWKRIIGWALAGLVMLLIIAAVGGYFYLRSSGFQKYALAKIVEQAERMARMRSQVREHNVYRWAAELISELSEIRLDTPEMAETR